MRDKAEKKALKKILNSARKTTDISRNDFGSMGDLMKLSRSIKKLDTLTSAKDDLKKKRK